MLRRGAWANGSQRAALLAAAFVTAIFLGAAFASGPAGGARGREPRVAPAPVLSVMAAASIARPIRAALDSFSARTGTAFVLEPGASLEIARRLTELHRTADVVLLADPELFPQLLMPRFANWYALFARDAIVLAYTPRSTGAAEITAANWRTVITRRGIEVGRADPNTDPSGYRAVLAMQLAALYYREPELFARLLAAAPPRNMRPREADQVALLQAQELDYIWTYRSLAERSGLEFVPLPDAVNLGNPGDSAAYLRASTRVLGRRAGDTLTVRGAPIQFALAIPLASPNVALAERFVAYLASEEGRRILRAQHMDVRDRFVPIGTGVPAAIRSP